MALSNWILLIALVIVVAHEQPMTSFTNGVLEFTNSALTYITNSRESMIAAAKLIDARMATFNEHIIDAFIAVVNIVAPYKGFVATFNQLAEALRPSRWAPQDLYGAFLNRMCH